LRGSTRANRNAIRPTSSPKPRCRRTGSTLGTRPPPDDPQSTQLRILKRWLRNVRDRHAARSRTTAGVSAG
jgi:hypothetical protein